MPAYQVTCIETVYVDRTYEVDAETAEEASSQIKRSKGRAGRLVDEQIQGSLSFVDVKSVHDEHGNVA